MLGTSAQVIVCQPSIEMWSFLSNAVAERLGSTSTCRKSSSSKQDCSDDEVSSCASKSLECPICWELFNIVENVPHVLWCGHTLCKNCVLSLQWAVVKLQTLPLQLLLLVSCPWCSRLSLRLVYNGNIMFPRKNYFLLWMVESMNGERLRSQSLTAGEQRPGNMLSGCHAYHQQNGQTTPHTHGQNSNSNQIHTRCTGNYFTTERIHASLFKSLAFFIQLTAKFPLILIFLLIILYAVPASAVILTLYIPITILLALPSFLVLYFAYPCLDWLLRGIFS